MTQISLADLVVRRVPLAPREAAMLTLAVAREWHRQRALYGPISLPEIAAIRLHATGDISFLVTPPACGDDTAAVLSALFARLIGDAGEGAHSLTHFTDDDPSALRAIFWRAAGDARIDRRRRQDASREPRTPSCERRRSATSATDLRRSIRTLEREVFESRHRALVPVRVQALARAMTGRARRYIAGIALAILVIGGFSAVRAGQTSPAPSVPAATSSAPIAEHRPAPIVATAERSGARTSAQLGPSRRVRRAGASRRAPTHATTPAAFAGGTRGIAWQTASR